MELLSSGQGALMTAAGTSGRTFDDGTLTENSNILGSAADAVFLTSDVGRAVTGTGVAADAFILGSSSQPPRSG